MTTFTFKTNPTSRTQLFSFISEQFLLGFINPVSAHVPIHQMKVREYHLLEFVADCSLEN